MIVTPGPALVLVPLGLAILAIEFAWARRVLRRVREKFPARAGRAAEKAKQECPGAEPARRSDPGHNAPDERTTPSDSSLRSPSG
jgi:hypothetical protein